MPLEIVGSSAGRSHYFFTALGRGDWRDPVFQAKEKLRRYGIVAFSSNYALYGDMSERVMSLIESMVPAAELYSIDECFADLSGVTGRLTQFGRDVRSKVLRCMGIPVGVGIARTKTLAKLANHTAKRLQAQTGGVVDIPTISSVTGCSETRR